MLDGLPIITDRLILNPFAESDAPFLCQLMNTPAYLKYVGDKGVQTEEEAADFIREKILVSYEEYGFGFYIVRLRHMDFPIGQCGLVQRDHLEDVDMGFGFLDEYQGQGYAYESAKALMEYAYDYHDIDRMLAITTEDNLPSRRLLSKLGFAVDQLIDWPDGTKLLQYHMSLYELYDE